MQGQCTTTGHPHSRQCWKAVLSPFDLCALSKQKQKTKNKKQITKNKKQKTKKGLPIVNLFSTGSPCLLLCNPGPFSPFPGPPLLALPPPHTCPITCPPHPTSTPSTANPQALLSLLYPTPHMPFNLPHLPNQYPLSPVTAPLQMLPFTLVYLPMVPFNPPLYPWNSLTLSGGKQIFVTVQGV